MVSVRVQLVVRHVKTVNTVSTVHLTAREVAIVKLATKEKCSKEMADVLCINTRTVVKHRKHIMEKTECKNFIGVVLFELKYKLIELDEI